MLVTDVDYRIQWDGAESFRPIFQITARPEGGGEETIGFTSDRTFEDEEEAEDFAEGFVYELTGD